MLDRVKPFDVWVAGLSDAEKAAEIEANGSLENAYWPLVRLLEREARDPAPRTATDTGNGVRFGW